MDLRAFLAAFCGETASDTLSKPFIPRQDFGAQQTASRKPAELTTRHGWVPWHVRNVVTQFLGKFHGPTGSFGGVLCRNSRKYPLKIIHSPPGFRCTTDGLLNARRDDYAPRLGPLACLEHLDTVSGQVSWAYGQFWWRFVQK